MANTLGRNIELPIYNADGTSFNGLSLRKFSVDNVVMSLGDKITGDVYYRGTNLSVTMQEYVVLKQNPDDESEEGVKYLLLNPPTIVCEGMVGDNSELKGMTKYSFVFYHPMAKLSNMPFADVAISSDETRYLSDSKTFSWIGKLQDFILKLNKNLQNTEWLVVYNNGNDQEQQEINDAKANVLSDVLPFDNSMISDALKTGYDTWKLPFVVDQLHEGEYYNESSQDYYTLGKRFVIVYGVPSNEIYEVDGQGQPTSTIFVFKFGQGVGLKNSSRSPKNNKVITRLAGYGSEDNIPYGYPQIRWYGNQDWDYTINNDPSEANSLPIYKGIVGGQYVKLIKHPFTRTHLMPSSYSAALFNKVSPYLANGNSNPSYNPSEELIDFIDADDPSIYPNPINELAPSYDIHQFESVKPELTEMHLVSDAQPYDYDGTISYITYSRLIDRIIEYSWLSSIPYEEDALDELLQAIYRATHTTVETSRQKTGSYDYEWECKGSKNFLYVTYKSSHLNFSLKSLFSGESAPTYTWNDDVDDKGEYVQSYFLLTLPALGFDLYACAAITQQMQLNMRSGDCIGCTFDFAVDWEDYKKNFYNTSGEFDPIAHTTSGDGHVRDMSKYPDTTSNAVTFIFKKDINTFGRIMPNIYQQPHGESSVGANDGDLFVILGISLPQTYVTNAETRLDGDMAQFLLENNVHYHEYPLKFDEHFLATHVGILSQMRNNTIVRFLFNNEELALYIKQMTTKYGDKVLPEYNITLTDDVEIVLNQVGQAIEDVSRVRVQLSELQKYYGQNVINELSNKLSRVSDDVALGRITFQQGINVLANAIFSGDIQSQDFISGLYNGRGWKVDSLGNAEFESARIRSVLEVIELLINRQQAQEGDTIFTDNDQIVAVETQSDVEHGTSYVLTLKEKWDGYVTSQQYGNILKGIINTLAAKEAGVSDESSTSVETDGENSYYTSWMQVIGTHSTDGSLGINQIRVTLYGDDQVPAQKNFVPCELMNIARWGCVLNPNEQGISEIEKQSRIRRQQVFYISTSDGRIAKLTGVNTPILRETNYGTTLGTIPSFINNWSIANRLIDGRDYLYAQGVIVGDFIKVDIQGDPIVEYVDCGEWYNGGAQGATPTIGHGIYLVNEKNENNLQYETHDVWRFGKKWRCLIHQPITSGGVTTYYEPKWNSIYWKQIEGATDFRMEFTSTNGTGFSRGSVSTTIIPQLFIGNEDITDDSSLTWNWERSSDLRTAETIAKDNEWNAAHRNMKQLPLTSADMPTWWNRDNRIRFTVVINVPDGRTIRFDF